MSDGGENTPSAPPSTPPSDRLDSWKEIAVYLRRGVSTVQRWEKEEGLPSHRLHHGKQGSVYAFKSELDAWLHDRRERIEVEGEVSRSDDADAPDGPGPPAADPTDVPAAEVPAAPATPPAAVQASEPNRWRTLPLWLGVAGAGLGLAVVIATRFRGSPSVAVSPGPPRTLPITSSRGLERHPALSPDGRQLAYVSNEAAETFDLYVKDVDSPSALRLTTSAASECCPAWSPDGQSLAFLRLVANEAVLMTIPALGGRAERRGDVTPWFGSALSFSPDGRLLAYSDRSSPGGPFVVKLLDLATGEVRGLTKATPDIAGDAFPRFSPDGRMVALTRLNGVAAGDVYVVPVEGGEPRRLTRDNRFVGDLDWTPDGRDVLFASDRVHAPRFWRISASGGEPALVWPGGDPFPASPFAEALMDVSAAFRFSVARSSSTQRIALTQRLYDTNIFRIDPRRPGEPAALPTIGSSQVDDSPQVSPDGRRIAFSSLRTGEQEIWVCNSDGSGCGSLVRARNGGTPRWSPDGSLIAFDDRPDPKRRADIFVIDVRTSKVRQVTTNDADDQVPSFSRDGRSIYFASNRTRRWQVFRASVQGENERQITHAGGFAAFEGPGGDTLFYTRFNLPGLFSVPRDGGPERQLLDMPRCWGHWTVAPDGLYVLDSREGQRTRLEFVDFGGGTPREVATFDEHPPCAESSLASTPDGRFLFYVGVEEGSDIVRVDGLK